MKNRPFYPIGAPVNVTAATAAATTALSTLDIMSPHVRVAVLTADQTAYIRFTSSSSAGTTTSNGIAVMGRSVEILEIPKETTHVDVIRGGATDVDMQFIIGMGGA